MPLFIRRTRKEKPPPLCGAVPAELNHTAKPGDMVAALIRQDKDEQTWILAEVVCYNASTKYYEVDDVDEANERYTLTKRRVVPLPIMRADPETDPDALHEEGAHIMALYPQTTCFYKGKIHERPKTARDDYQVLFEDPNYPEGYSPALTVPQKYVIKDKDGHKRVQKK